MAIAVALILDIGDGGDIDLRLDVALAGSVAVPGAVTLAETVTLRRRVAREGSISRAGDRSITPAGAGTIARARDGGFTRAGAGTVARAGDVAVTWAAPLVCELTGRPGAVGSAAGGCTRLLRRVAVSVTVSIPQGNGGA